MYNNANVIIVSLFVLLHYNIITDINGCNVSYNIFIFLKRPTEAPRLEVV